VNVLTARARVGWKAGEPFVQPHIATAGTFILGAKPHPEQMLKAGIIVGEQLHEFYDGHGLCHGV
jgi:hypothetical protein